MALPGSFAAAATLTEAEEAKVQEYARKTEQLVVDWIEAVATTEARGQQSTAEWLRSGLVLCRLVNHIVPGLVQESRGSTPSRMLENIRRFLQVAQSFGLHEDELFSPLDLLEKSNLWRVLQCLKAFAEVVNYNVPAYRGPQLGATRGGCAARCSSLLGALLAPLLGGPPAPAAMPVERFQSYAISSRSAAGSLLVNDRFGRFAEKKSSVSLGSASTFQAKKSVSGLSATNSLTVNFFRAASVEESDLDETVRRLLSSVEEVSRKGQPDLDEASTECGSERGDLVDVDM